MNKRVDFGKERTWWWTALAVAVVWLSWVVATMNHADVPVIDWVAVGLLGVAVACGGMAILIRTERPPKD